MKKVIEIEQCQDCPHYIYGQSLCEIKGDHGKPVPQRSKIPDWCPLETSKEYCESNFNIDD